MSLANHARAWAPAVLWAAFLFVSSSIPDLDGPTWIPLNDKVAHAVVYAVLGATLVWGRRHAPSSPTHGVLLALGLLYGVSDEWHQMYVPGRTPDALDLLADAFGLLVGYGTTWTLLGRTTDGSIPAAHDDDHDRDAS